MRTNSVPHFADENGSNELLQEHVELFLKSLMMDGWPETEFRMPTNGECRDLYAALQPAAHDPTSPLHGRAVRFRYVLVMFVTTPSDVHRSIGQLQLEADRFLAALARAV